MAARQIVKEFQSQLASIGMDLFPGIYLTGSISLQDFYPNKSDLDFIVVCSDFPNEDVLLKLKSIHMALRSKYPKPDLSGSYIESSSLHASDIFSIKAVSYHQGVFTIRNLEMAPVVLFELKSNGITIYGSEAKQLPIQVDKAVLNQFMSDNINTYWMSWTNRYSSWTRLRILLILFPRLTEWSVLGVARQLCTLKTGRVVSKTDAGEYCLLHLPPQFHPILREAISIRKDDRSYPMVRTYALRPSFSRAKETIECLRFIARSFNNAMIKV